MVAFSAIAAGASVGLGILDALMPGDNSAWAQAESRRRELAISNNNRTNNFNRVAYPLQRQLAWQGFTKGNSNIDFNLNLAQGKYMLAKQTNIAQYAATRRSPSEGRTRDWEKSGKAYKLLMSQQLKAERRLDESISTAQRQKVVNQQNYQAAARGANPQREKGIPSAIPKPEENFLGKISGVLDAVSGYGEAKTAFEGAGKGLKEILGIV